MFRFLLDQTQTPNTKVKVNTLRYLRSVLEAMDAANFPAEDPDLPLAVTKVRMFTSRSGAGAPEVAMAATESADGSSKLEPCR